MLKPKASFGFQITKKVRKTGKLKSSSTWANEWQNLHDRIKYGSSLTLAQKFEVLIYFGP